MSIICGISARSEGALHAAEALARNTSLGAISIIDLDRPNAGAELLATARTANLIVVAAANQPSGSVETLAHEATVPTLLVRDPAPFIEWAREERPLRAVLGWDESTTTSGALGPLDALRAAGPVDLEVVHVYFPDEAARRYGVRIDSMVEPSAQLQALLHRDIAHHLGEIGGAGMVAITPLLGIGHIGEHLVEHAMRRRADLVVVGTHHRHGLRRLSSVAERVLEQARCAVMLVPRPPAARFATAHEFRIAVVATDGTTFANTAVPYAYGLVPDGGEVHVVRVVRNGEQADDESLMASLRVLHPESRATQTIPHVVRDRDPAHAIAVTAEQVGADVICIASHGRAGISRALTGSVTDRLLHMCRRPVLVIHAVE